CCWRTWQRLQKRIDVSQFLVRQYLLGIRRHLARRFSDVSGEHLERNGIGANARSGGLRALSLEAVTLVAAVLREEPLPIFSIAGRRGRRWRRCRGRLAHCQQPGRTFTTG